MGVGASNISTSDLSVYQSALTKITQDLLNSTANVSSIDLNANQTINFTNGSGPDILGCSTRTTQIVKCQSNCSTLGAAAIAANTPNAEKVYNDCIQGCADLECTPAQIQAEQATFNCSNVSLTNNAGQTASTTQIAKSTVNAQMTVDIQNQFESEVDKTINQTNKDLNFMQFNSSSERTTVSQTIRNDISQAIANTSSNLSSQQIGDTQVINFTNTGIINCSDCPSTTPVTNASIAVTNFPGCTLSISNKDIQTASVNQTATSALAAVLNAKVLNDLTSKYTLAVTQTNAGVNLLDLLLPILILIIVFVLVLPITAWALRPFLGKLAIGLTVVIVIAAVFFVGLWGGGLITIPGVKSPPSAGSSTTGVMGSGGSVLPETNNPAGYVIINPGSGYKTGTACMWDNNNHQQTSCPSYESPISTASTTKSVTQDIHMIINITSVDSNGGITGYTLNNGGTGYTAGNQVTAYQSGSNNNATFQIQVTESTASS